MEGLSNRRQNQVGVAEGSQRDEVDAIGEVVEELARTCERQACFAHTACAGEGHQAHLRAAQESTQGCYLVLAPNQRREGGGQIACWGSPSWFGRSLPAGKQEDVVLHRRLLSTRLLQEAGHSSSFRDVQGSILDGPHSSIREHRACFF